MRISGGVVGWSCAADVDGMAKECILNAQKLMNAKRSMTLNLTDAEMAVVGELAQKKELSKTAVIRQAIRLYQMLDARMARGEKLFFEDEAAQKKAELMLL